MSRMAPAETARGGRLTRLLSGLATPLTTGLFAVSVASGVALFFHVQPGAFHSMHVWLSLAWLLPFALHLWRNWRSFLGYIRRGTLAVPVILCVLLAVPFAWAGLTRGRGGNVGAAATTALAGARLADLGAILHLPPDRLRAELARRGCAPAAADTTLDAVAGRCGQPSRLLLGRLLVGPLVLSPQRPSAS